MVSFQSEAQNINFKFNLHVISVEDMVHLEVAGLSMLLINSHTKRSSVYSSRPQMVMPVL